MIACVDAIMATVVIIPDVDAITATAVITTDVDAIKTTEVLDFENALEIKTWSCVSMIQSNYIIDRQDRMNTTENLVPRHESPVQI